MTDKKYNNQQNRVTDWRSLIIPILLFVLLIQFSDFNDVERRDPKNNLKGSSEIEQNTLSMQETVIPAEGVVLPVQWGSLGKEMIESGVIDQKKFESIYDNKSSLSEEDLQILSGTDNGALVINEQNSGLLLNMLWAFGLSNRNDILSDGPIQDPKYGDVGRFASTGGWTLAKGNAMDHYNRHDFVTLTPEQQSRVERVSKNIYRPCCGNSTHFPDCNHGMAMLGLLQLLAVQDLTEEEMYEIALQVNSYWFPNNYLTIASYFDQQGIDWKDVSPEEILSANYSSSSGYKRILEEISPKNIRKGGGCSV